MLRARRLGFGQMLLAAVLGVSGGIYVYLPIFRPAPPGREQPEEQRDAGARGGGQRVAPG